jgi:hypothetical protein
MSATAALISWYERIEERGAGGRRRIEDADIAGG